MPTQLSFKSFYPRWIGWNVLGLGMTGAILSVIEFSGLMGNGLYKAVQNTTVVILIYLLIAGLTAACVYLTQRQLMQPYLQKGLFWWGMAAAVPLGVILPNASDFVFALAGAALATWLVLRQEFARAYRWLLWALLPAEILAVSGLLIKQYLLGLMLGDWLADMSSSRLLILLMGYNLLSVLLVALVSGVGMYFILSARKSPEECAAHARHNQLWLLWILAPMLVNFILTNLAASGLLRAVQALPFYAAWLPSFQNVVFALLITLAQTLVLKRYFSGATRWIIPTLAGFLLSGLLVTPLGDTVSSWVAAMTTANSSLPAFLASMSIAVAQALIVGILQMMVLKKWASRRWGFWPLILVVSEILGPLAPFPMARELISGFGLVRLTRPEPAEPPFAGKEV